MKSEQKFTFVEAFSITLTAIGLALLIYSLIWGKPFFDYFGLIPTMPPLPASFFLALFSFTLASFLLWNFHKNQEGLLMVQFFFLAIGLHFAPYVMGNTKPLFEWHYFVWVHTDYIIEQGHFSDAIYHWPGQMIGYAVLYKILGLTTPKALLAWSVFLSPFPIYAFIYLFLRRILREKNYPNRHWGGMWIFSLGTWAVQIGPLPQGAAISIFYLLIALLIRHHLIEGLKAVGYRLSCILSMGFITFTHLLTSFLSFGTMAALFVARRLKSINLVIISAIFIIAWMIYETFAWFAGSLPSFLEAAFRWDKLFKVEIIEPMRRGSIAHQNIVSFKIATVLVFSIIAIIGFLLMALSYLKSRKMTHSDVTILALIGGVLAPAIVIGAGYGAEHMQRLWAFLLPSLAFLGIKLLNLRATSILLCIILIILVPLVIASGFGPFEFYFLSPSEIEALHFFHNSAPDAHIRVGTFWFSGKYYHKSVFVTSYEALRWEGDILLHQDPRPLYIVISQQVKDFCEYGRGDEGLQLINSIEVRLNETINSNLFYANNKTKLYITQIM